MDELLLLVQEVAHHRAVLTGIALEGALDLEREQNVSVAVTSFLGKVHLFVLQSGHSSARKLLKKCKGEVAAPTQARNEDTQGVTSGPQPEHAGNPSSNFSGRRLASHPPSDLCVKCGLAIEEECVRLGAYQRWHPHCVQCVVCKKSAALHPSKEKKEKEKTIEKRDNAREKNGSLKLSTARRPADIEGFAFDPRFRKKASSGRVPMLLLCADHAYTGCRGGFQLVSRLEQYAFLLNVALRALCSLLKKQGAVPSSSGT
jgi:hypothetical protein